MTKGGVLITGAGKRIGRHIALFLGKQGYPVAVHFGASGDEAGAVVDAITKAGGKAVALQADLADYAQTAGLAPEAEKAIGAPVTVLVNNAAAFGDDTLQSFTETDWTRSLDTNLRAPAVLSQAFAKALPQDRDGNIINIIDQRVLKLETRQLTYTISKHALWDLTRILAAELAPRIRVNGIAPGPTLPSIHQSEKEFAVEVENTPLGRGPALDEIAAAVDFLLASPSVTGNLIALDGGQHLL